MRLRPTCLRSLCVLIFTPPLPCTAPALQYGNGSLRLTTRMTFQLHGVLKQNLKTVFSTVG